MADCWLPDWEVDCELEFEIGLWRVPCQEAKGVVEEVLAWVSAVAEAEGPSVACIAPEVLWRTRHEESTACRELWTSTTGKEPVSLYTNSLPFPQGPYYSHPMPLPSVPGSDGIPGPPA